MSIEIIANECYFAGENVMSMTNSKKRNLLYFWFANNVYSICGKSNRKKIQGCLVYAIRKCYPNEDGKYTNYENVYKN